MVRRYCPGLCEDTLNGYCLAVLVTALLLFTFPAWLQLCVEPAWADGLEVVASAPEAGADKVPTSGRYWVQFSHNVASVEENAQRVELLTDDGKEVPAKKCTVSVPDYQTEFGFRQYVYLDVKGLDAGMRYTIHVDGDAEAKNGSTLGEDLDISFTTAKKGENAIALAEPKEVEGGKGDGSGGGNGGSGVSGGSNSSVIASGSEREGADKAGAEGESKVKLLAPDGEGQADAGASGREPVPMQVIVIAIAALLVIMSALVLRARKAKQNAPRGK